MATLTVAQYETAQLRVAELAASRVPELASLEGFEKWAQAVLDLITLGGRTAAAMAVQGHLAGREAAGLQSRYTPRATGFVGLEQAASSLQWAAGVPEAMEATPRSRAEGVVNRYVLQPARETTIVAATEDPVATRIARVPGPNSCAFCLLLATRVPRARGVDPSLWATGAAYHDTGSAGRNANSRFVGEGEYKFHDHDQCTVRVVWEGEEYEPPAHVQEAADVYAAATAGVDGTKAKLAAFRAAMASRRAE